MRNNLFVFAGKSSQWLILCSFFLKRKGERLLNISIFLPITNEGKYSRFNTFMNIKMCY